jgi:hypothetical protein
MAKPTTLPLWATTGTKVTPTAGQQQAGWSPDDKPPAHWFNWWQNLVYTWILWLDGKMTDGSSGTRIGFYGVDSTATGTGAGLVGHGAGATGTPTNYTGVYGDGSTSGAGFGGEFVGSASGAGVSATGGSGGGTGAVLTGGALSGEGAVVTGGGGTGNAGDGIQTTGGASSGANGDGGAGLVATGGAPNGSGTGGNGVTATGNAAGWAIQAVGGTVENAGDFQGYVQIVTDDQSGANPLTALKVEAGAATNGSPDWALEVQGGDATTSGNGGRAITAFGGDGSGTAAADYAVHVTAGNGTSGGGGVYAFSYNDQAAIYGQSNSGYGVVADGNASGGGSNKAPFRIVPNTSDPGSLDNGAMWIDGSDVHVRIGGSTYTLDKTAA